MALCGLDEGCVRVSEARLEEIPVSPSWRKEDRG